MKATERIDQLKGEELARYRAADPRFDDHYRAYLEAALVRGIGMYLDEEQIRREVWEKSVEERLQHTGWLSITTIPPPRGVDVLVLSLATGEVCVAEHSRGDWCSAWFDADSFSPKPSENWAATHWMPIAQLPGAVPFPISDAGPSKYDVEPEDLPE